MSFSNISNLFQFFFRQGVIRVEGNSQSMFRVIWPRPHHSIVNWDTPWCSGGSSLIGQQLKWRPLIGRCSDFEDTQLRFERLSWGLTETSVGERLPALFELTLHTEHSCVLTNVTLIFIVHNMSRRICSALPPGPESRVASSRPSRPCRSRGLFYPSRSRGLFYPCPTGTGCWLADNLF